MKKIIIIISSMMFLSGCENRSLGQARYDAIKPSSVCIEGLSFATIHSVNGMSITQIFEPAQSPNNPPQPKTCNDQETK